MGQVFFFPSNFCFSYSDIQILSTLSKGHIFGISTKCSSKNDVRLKKSQLKGNKKGRDRHYISDRLTICKS